MNMFFAILALVLAVWAIRSIFFKRQSISKKIGKSIFSAWYFLTASGLASEKYDAVLAAIVMMLVGGLVVWYCNRNYKAPAKNEDLISEHANAIKDFDLEINKTKPSKFRSVNHASGKDAEIKAVAFSYVNSKGESSFRDVDIKSFDGKYLEGYCHLSRKFKTFRLDRIEGEIIIRETGEAIDPYEWAGLMEAR